MEAQTQAKKVTKLITIIAVSRFMATIWDAYVENKDKKDREEKTRKLCDFLKNSFRFRSRLVGGMDRRIQRRVRNCLTFTSIAINGGKERDAQILMKAFLEKTDMVSSVVWSVKDCMKRVTVI